MSHKYNYPGNKNNESGSIVLLIIADLFFVLLLALFLWLILSPVIKADAQEINKVYLPYVYSIQPKIYSDPNPFVASSCDVSEYIGYGRYEVYWDDGYLNSVPCKIQVLTSDNKLTELNVVGKVNSRFSGVTITLIEYSPVNFYWEVKSNLPIQSITIFE